MRSPVLFFLATAAAAGGADADSLSRPIAERDLVFEESGGLVAVEAEHFFRQEKAEVRAWYRTTADDAAGLKPDADPPHVAGASGGAYLEVLPDTRRDHGEKLIKGENFTNEPGEMAVLSYRVFFHTPGKYYVWGRAHSTGTEDNGLHVGIDGKWPESGQRMQWTGKNNWVWGSKQRTEEVHTGVPGMLFLEVEKPGEHVIQFSMREDGFEFDQWLMTTDADFKAPGGPAPISKAKAGDAPEPYPNRTVGADHPPAQQREPAPQATKPSPESAAMVLEDFDQRDGQYLDRDRWLAIDPDQRKEARAAGAFPFQSGTFDLTLHAVGENDGRSTYEIIVDGKSAGKFECPLGSEEAITSEGAKFTQTFKGIPIESGALVEVRSRVGTEDGEEFSRARWSRLAVAAADGKPVIRNRGIQRPANAPADAAGAGAGAAEFTDALFGERQADGDGSVEVSGELKQWHKVTLTLDGPFAHERDNQPNPFADYELRVLFKHESGEPSYVVPGYFAADGDAGETSAECGTKWRAHLSPDKPGTWTYTIQFRTSTNAALGYKNASKPLAILDGKKGSFAVAASDKSGRDLRGKGRLQYVGGHHLRFAGSGEYFLKAGADAPETLLAYADFDNTVATKPGKAPLKTFAAHVRDWRPGDPAWQGGKGKGLVGAINYLSGKGANAFSFLPYNVGGDGDNVWPFVAREDKLHYDCSKLDQWGTVFDHGTAMGMYLHFKLQETENDDNRPHGGAKGGKVAAALDGGDLGPERRLYCRELIARFAHNLALNWNLGEENTQSSEQQREMADFIHRIDPYDHLIVVHTFPDQQDKVYRPLLGDQSALRGASLQNSNVADCHRQVVKWVRESAKAGAPWVVAFDEPGTAAEGMPPDPGYPGTPENFDNPSIHQVRQQVLWGTLLAGGGGVEYYFGYRLPQNDLVCEDWRSRDQSWDYCRIALDFFRDEKIPFQDMANADALVGNPDHGNDRYCFAKEGEIYLVYLPAGGAADLDLSGASGEFRVGWFDPRQGGALQPGGSVKGGATAKLVAPSKGAGDWLAVVRRAER